MSMTLIGKSLDQGPLGSLIRCGIILALGCAIKKSPLIILFISWKTTPRASFALRMMQTMPGIVFFHDAKQNKIQYHSFRHSSTGEDIDQKLGQSQQESSATIGAWHARAWPLDILDVLAPTGVSSSASKCLFCDE